ncbi:MAG: hypothetical protein J0M02_04615 [Planctomycetes bacterium]|nr:hypothetical protein [Planctomycetota bacterium]
MALSDAALTALSDPDATPDVTARQLYKQIKAAWLVAHASGLAIVTYTLPTGVSRTISIAEAITATKALRDLVAFDDGDVVFQTAELP